MTLYNWAYFGAANIAVFSALYFSVKYLLKWKKPLELAGEIEALFIYPIKGVPGFQIPIRDQGSSIPVEMTKLGLKYGELKDRQYLLGFYNKEGEFEFYTMRVKPKLALVSTEPNETLTGLKLRAPGMLSIELNPPHIENSARISVTIWRTTCQALECDPPVGKWFDQLLGIQGTKVVYTGGVELELPRRVPKDDPVFGKYAAAADANSRLNFNDSSHALIVNRKSFEDLNSRLETGVDLIQFRCNILARNTPRAYDEDEWAHVHVNGVTLARNRPCLRCMVTTVDPLRGVHRHDREPIKTLKKYRSYPQFPGDPGFGTLYMCTTPGVLNVGDKLYVSRKSFSF